MSGERCWYGPTQFVQDLGPKFVTVGKEGELCICSQIYLKSCPESLMESAKTLLTKKESVEQKKCKDARR